jgi:DNA-directed RNA polymerase subunit RPC12/RpoP
MPIVTQCPNADCGKSFELDEDKIGRRAVCKKCGSRFRVQVGKGELISDGLAAGEEESPGAAAKPSGTQYADEGDIPANWKVGDKILDLYEVTGNLGEGGMGK